MKILLSGSNGLVGRALSEHTNDHLIKLVRKKEELDQNSILWDPENSEIEADLNILEGLDAVIHLSGEGIANKRWSPEQKQKILNSRIKSTQFLSEIIAKLKIPPKVFICASAVGYYGDRGDQTCTENTEKGVGFLSDVCQQWEEATNLAKSAGIRTVNLRFGVILSSKGGALAKMLTPFKFGLGGVLGSGEQYMSWIAIDDVIGIIREAINNPSLSGPINVVSPNPLTNKEFTKTLGEVLKRPTIIPVPAFALRLLLGEEMANEILLSSTKVIPEKLINSNYKFIYSDLKNALIGILS